MRLGASECQVIGRINLQALAEIERNVRALQRGHSFGIIGLRFCDANRIPKRAI